MPSRLTLSRRYYHFGNTKKCCGAEKYQGCLRSSSNSILIVGLTLADGEKAKVELACQGKSLMSEIVRVVIFWRGNPDVSGY